MSIIKQDFNTLKGGGGKLVETQLWKNSSPTAGNFAPQQISLSESINNFDFIKITARLSSSDATSLGSSLMSVSDFKQTSSSGSLFFLTGTGSNSNRRRSAYFVSTTAIYINADGGGSMYNYIIPTYVHGVKLE